MCVRKMRRNEWKRCAEILRKSCFEGQQNDRRGSRFKIDFQKKMKSNNSNHNRDHNRNHNSNINGKMNVKDTLDEQLVSVGASWRRFTPTSSLGLIIVQWGLGRRVERR